MLTPGRKRKKRKIHKDIEESWRWFEKAGPKPLRVTGGAEIVHLVDTCVQTLTAKRQKSLSQHIEQSSSSHLVRESTSGGHAPLPREIQDLACLYHPNAI